MQRITKTMFVQLFFPYLNFSNQVKFCHSNKQNKECAILRYNDENIQQIYIPQNDYVDFKLISESVLPLIRHLFPWHCNTAQFALQFLQKCVNLTRLEFHADQNFSYLAHAPNSLKQSSMSDVPTNSIELAALRMCKNLVSCTFYFKFTDILFADTNMKDIIAILEALQINSKSSIKTLEFHNVLFPDTNGLEILKSLPEYLLGFENLQTFEVYFNVVSSFESENLSSYETLLICWKEAQIKCWPTIPCIDYQMGFFSRPLYSNVFQKIALLRQETKELQKRDEVIQKLQSDVAVIYLYPKFTETEIEALKCLANMPNATRIMDRWFTPRQDKLSDVDPFSIVPPQSLKSMQCYKIDTHSTIRIQQFRSAFEKGLFASLNELQLLEVLVSDVIGNLTFHSVSKLVVERCRMVGLKSCVNRIKAAFPNLKKIIIDVESYLVFSHQDLVNFLTAFNQCQIWFKVASNETFRNCNDLFARFSNVKIEVFEEVAYSLTVANL